MDESSGNNAVELKLAQIEEALDRTGLALRFSNGLEKQFEQETGPTRTRAYVRMGLLQLALFDLLIVLDYFSLPDIFGLALFLRFGLGTGIFALVLWIISRNPPASIREGLTVMSYLVQALVIYALVVASSNPLRENYHLGILLTLMFTVMILRLRFRYSLFLAVALVVVQVMTLFSIPELAMESKGGATFLSIAMAAFALMAVHDLEKLERVAWLHSLRDRLRAQLFEDLSVIDPLTGLGNRRALQQWVETQRTATAGQSVSLLVVDIDYFKSYNDTFGHIPGDACIRRVSGTLVAEARKTGDRAFRFGGEEFIVVLVGVDLLVAITVAERMRRAIAAMCIPHKTPSGLGHLTASFGIASGEFTPVFDLEALIEEADGALYQAKQNGRNRVVPPLIALTESIRTVS